MGKDGSRPVTLRVAPIGIARRARSTSRWPPRSSPRSSRSIVACGDIAFGVVEVEGVDGVLEGLVAGGAAFAPGFQAFEVEKRSEEHTSELQSHSFISYAVFR